jgi:hypothetical protein
MSRQWRDRESMDKSSRAIYANVFKVLNKRSRIKESETYSTLKLCYEL